MSTFGELKRQVMMRLGGSLGGDVNLAVEQAINDAHKVIAEVRDFDELMVLDTTNAETVDGQKSYHIIDDLGLVRPKDIYSIRYMDEDNSRKLEYVSLRKLDDRVPYTEMVGTGRPTYYTRRGMYIELFRIPDDDASLYIQHSQWPDTLEDDDDESPYLNIDNTIVTLASDMALAIIDGTGAGASWTARASQLLGLSVKEVNERPDRLFIAQPFSKRKVPIGEYWANPFVKE